MVNAVNSAQQSDGIRLKAKIVTLENHQRPEIDFQDTFAPVARMSLLRLLIALETKLGRDIDGGSINAAYPDSSPIIKRYLRPIS